MQNVDPLDVELLNVELLDVELPDMESMKYGYSLWIDTIVSMWIYSLSSGSTASGKRMKL